jgi:CheY-like chemotaxis protein
MKYTHCPNRVFAAPVGGFVSQGPGLLNRCGEITEEALAAGADEVLLKPINPNALVWVVDKLVT